METMGYIQFLYRTSYKNADLTLRVQVFLRRKLFDFKFVYSLLLCFFRIINSNNQIRYLLFTFRLSAFTALKSMEKAFAESEKDSLYNNMRLSSRAGVLFKWKLELERDILDLNAEIKLILDEKKRLQKSIRALALVKSINNEMKSNRCLRMESELVRDQVDEEVFKVFKSKLKIK